MIVLFDLDGTLFDPFDAFKTSLSYACEKLGIQPPSDQAVREGIGPPLIQTFQLLIGPRKELWNSFVALYREHHMRTCVELYKIYPDARMTLQRLAKKYPLFLATSKAWDFAEMILKAHDIDSCFDGIYGAEPDGRNGHKPDLLAEFVIREKLKLAKHLGRAVMIGDRLHDVVAGKSVGFQTIGVSWGYGTRAELEQACADRVINQFAELEDTIGQL